MAIEQQELRQAATRSTTLHKRAGLATGQRTAFLCHSHKDRDLALGLQQRLKEDGLDLYIDWQDSTMPPEPDRRTAERIQAVIRSADIFVFLATADSVASRWCPWEIGYADGTKRLNQILVVPTSDSSGRHHGNEYLQLYRHLDRHQATGVWRWYSQGSQVANTLSTF